MSLCPFCGKKLFQSFARWYRYDNGEQFRENVCASCAAIHDSLLKASA
jgi:hypothetical protein